MTWLTRKLWGRLGRWVLAGRPQVLRNGDGPVPPESHEDPLILDQLEPHDGSFESDICKRCAVTHKDGEPDAGG